MRDEVTTETPGTTPTDSTASNAGTEHEPLPDLFDAEEDAAAPDTPDKPDTDTEDAQTPETPTDDADKPPATDKVRQQMQQELANFQKNVIAPLTDQLTSIAQRIEARGGDATPTQQKKADQAAHDLVDLQEQLGVHDDDIVDYKTLKKAIAGRGKESIDDIKQQIAALVKETVGDLPERFKQKEQAEQQQAQAKAFWLDYSAKNPGVDGQSLWKQALAEAKKAGFENDQGYATAVFKQLEAKAKASGSHRSSKGKDDSAKPVEGAAVSTPGASAAIDTSTATDKSNGLPDLCD